MLDIVFGLTAWLVSHINKKLSTCATLEQSACVGGPTSWKPEHLLLYDADKLIGVLPFYIHYDSSGEYIFDHNWADAYACSGLSYYQPIEYAIANNISIFEAGAQGEHKFLRGFDTTPCYSSHWIVHPQERSAIQYFLAKEQEYMQTSLEVYEAHSPRKEVRENRIENE